MTNLRELEDLVQVTVDHLDIETIAKWLESHRAAAYHEICRGSIRFNLAYHNRH